MQFRSFDARVRWVVVAPFLVAAALLAGLAAGSIDVLSGARAFVGAEGQWSKAQKNAMYDLTRYTTWRKAPDYQRFVDELQVLQGSRLARLEMDRPDPDLRVARQALIQGRNHPDDIDSMIRLYRRFSTHEPMSHSVPLWVEADEHVQELTQVGEDIHARVAAGEDNSPELQSLIDRAELLNARLTDLNARFADISSDAARTAERLMLWGMFITGTLITCVGLGLSWYLMRREARTARALRESNERWTLATEAAGIGVFDWDVSRDRVAIDARTALLCGLPPEAAVLNGTTLSKQHVHAEDEPRLRRALRSAVQNPAPLRIRCRVGTERTRFRHVQLNARTRTRGQVTRLIGIMSDVSDDVLAQQLRLDKESAERANRAKSSFLSRMSHELRTPLNAVLGFGQLLQTDPHEPLTPAQNQRMQHVLDAGQHLLELINDLLDITGLENDSVQLQRVALRLDEVIDTSLAHVQPLALAPQIAIHCVRDAGAEGLVVQGDAMRLRQGLEHLLANAVKYNRPGGRVDVAVQRRDGLAVLAVTDTGPGLTAEQLERLFQPFDRLGAENTRISGTGLGLVITQQLVQRMGGSLTVTSEPGRGTRVELQLPLWVEGASPVVGPADANRHLPPPSPAAA